MIIKNGLVFGTDGNFAKRDVYVNEKHWITESPMPGDCDVLDASGLYVIPGLVDVHIHGSVGHDFSDGDPDGLLKIAAYLKSHGVTSFCPTSMTLPTEKLERSFQSIFALPQNGEHASVAGIHMEGPFISPAKKGAQNGEYIVSPDIARFQELNEASGGMIRLVTIAPELPGSLDFIKALHDTVSISLGHTESDYDTTLEAFKAGANHATHLFNAMPPLLHRNPGVIGAAFDSPHVMVELICDGVHLAPAVIRMAFQLFGEDRVVLISDALRAAGMEDGTYELGGQQIFKKGNWATLKDGTLAGSVTNLFDCMKKAVSLGIPLKSAVKAASVNPARSIRAEQIGGIAPGKRADLLLVDKELNLIRVL